MKSTTSKSILLFALAASTALVADVEAESFRNLQARIVGGDEASPGEYPYFGKRANLT
jgi:hypothetical protein